MPGLPYFGNPDRLIIRRHGFTQLQCEFPKVDVDHIGIFFSVLVNTVALRDAAHFCDIYISRQILDAVGGRVEVDLLHASEDLHILVRTQLHPVGVMQPQILIEAQFELSAAAEVVGIIFAGELAVMHLDKPVTALPEREAVVGLMAFGGFGPIGAGRHVHGLVLDLLDSDDWELTRGKNRPEQRGAGVDDTWLPASTELPADLGDVRGHEKAADLCWPVIRMLLDRRFGKFADQR